MEQSKINSEMTNLQYSAYKSCQNENISFGESESENYEISPLSEEENQEVMLGPNLKTFIIGLILIIIYLYNKIKQYK